MLLNLLHCVGMKNMDHNLFYERLRSRVNTPLSLSDMTCMKTNPEVVIMCHMPDGMCVGICISTSRDSK